MDNIELSSEIKICGTCAEWRQHSFTAYGKNFSTQMGSCLLDKSGETIPPATHAIEKCLAWKPVPEKEQENE